MQYFLRMNVIRENKSFKSSGRSTTPLEAIKQTQCTSSHECIIVRSRNSSVFTRLSFINRTMSQPFPNKLPPTVFLIGFVLVAFSARALLIYLNSVCVENIRYASDDLVEKSSFESEFPA